MNTDKVSGSTVNRKLNLLSNLFTVAAQEWKWIASSPTTAVRRPNDSEARDRLYTDDQVQRVCLALGYDLDDEQQAATVSQRVTLSRSGWQSPPPGCALTVMRVSMKFSGTRSLPITIYRPERYRNVARRHDGTRSGCNTASGEGEHVAFSLT